MQNKIKPITINIHVRVGQPCIRGTEIETQDVACRFASGQSLRELAADYGLGVHKIEAALRFELGSAAQRRELAEIADTGPILTDGNWYVLNPETLHW